MSDVPSQPLILYDGMCGLCNRSVNFVIDHDPSGHFCFATLQSPLAERLLGQGTEQLASVVLVEEGKIYRRSTAAIRIAGGLSGAWPVLRVFLLIPWPIRDWVYDWVARHRYQWFGKYDACRLPEPAIAERFLG